MSWADATIFILCLILFVVAYVGLLKFISLHFENLRKDIFATVLSLLEAVKNGIQKNIENDELSSTNGHGS